MTKDEPKYTKADVQAKVLAILTASGFVDSVSDGPVGLVLDQTSFYAESGGQTNDTGVIAGPSGSITIGDAQVRGRGQLRSSLPR